MRLLEVIQMFPLGNVDEGVSLCTAMCNDPVGGNTGLPGHFDCKGVSCTNCPLSGQTDQLMYELSD